MPTFIKICQVASENNMFENKLKDNGGQVIGVAGMGLQAR